jgi:hypothetical protein
VPITVEMKLADSMPWAMRVLNGVFSANVWSRWTGFVSPETPANNTMSASVIVLP